MSKIIKLVNKIAEELDLVPEVPTRTKHKIKGALRGLGLGLGGYGLSQLTGNENTPWYTPYLMSGLGGAYGYMSGTEDARRKDVTKEYDKLKELLRAYKINRIGDFDSIGPQNQSISVRANDGIYF